jgi:hypothetical protein
MRYRLALRDGTVIEVSRGDGEEGWRLDRELGEGVERPGGSG